MVGDQGVHEKCGQAFWQELAAAMGGRIALDSTPGQGTDFTVDLRAPTGERLDQLAMDAEAVLIALCCAAS